jgi:hypothetical protein
VRSNSIGSMKFAWIFEVCFDLTPWLTISHHLSDPHSTIATLRFVCWKAAQVVITGSASVVGKITTTARRLADISVEILQPNLTPLENNGPNEPPSLLYAAFLAFFAAL